MTPTATRPPRRLALALVAALAFLSGCYESSRPLGPADRGQVDPELLGEWACRSAGKDPKDASLAVLAYDDRRFVLRWREGDETTHWAAHSSIVGGGLLYNVRELKPDGRATKWVFLRALSPARGELSLSVVKDEALKGLAEPAALGEIRRRVNDEALYEPWASCRRPPEQAR